MTTDKKTINAMMRKLSLDQLIEYKNFILTLKDTSSNQLLAPVCQGKENQEAP